MKGLVLALALVGLGTGAACAQPEDLDGGVFIVHSPPGLVYTDTEDYCTAYASQWAITSCDQEHPRVDSYEVTVWYVLAAWNEAKRFCGVEFGLGAYDPDLCGFADDSPCPASALIIPYGSWPGPGTGVSLAAAGEPWDGNFLPVYFFAAYAYYAGQVPLAVHPGTGFAGFADCLTPPTSYPAVAFGAMGLFQDGVPACPPPVFHVCCVCQECYLVLTEDECAGMGGFYIPHWHSCEGVPCSEMPVACCIGHECVLVHEEDCEIMMGHSLPGVCYCDPNPCDVYTPAGASNWGAIKAIYR